MMVLGFLITSSQFMFYIMFTFPQYSCIGVLLAEMHCSDWLIIRRATSYVICVPHCARAILIKYQNIKNNKVKKLSFHNIVKLFQTLLKVKVMFIVLMFDCTFCDVLDHDYSINAQVQCDISQQLQLKISLFFTLPEACKIQENINTKSYLTLN